MIQMLHPGISVRWTELVVPRVNLRKVKGSDAEVISQILYPRLVAFSGVGREICSGTHLQCSDSVVETERRQTRALSQMCFHRRMADLAS